MASVCSAVVDRGLAPMDYILPPRRGSVWYVTVPWVSTHGWDPITAMRFQVAFELALSFQL